MTLTSRHSASLCLRMTRIASMRPISVMRELPVSFDAQQAVAFHPGDRLADRRAALREPLGDARTQRDDALFLKLKDRPKVHLGSIDQAVRCHSRLPPESMLCRTGSGVYQPAIRASVASQAAVTAKVTVATEQIP